VIPRPVAKGTVVFLTGEPIAVGFPAAGFCCAAAMFAQRILRAASLN